jgi:sugar transferase (PEP-CTERM system associated)
MRLLGHHLHLPIVLLIVAEFVVANIALSVSDLLLLTNDQSSLPWQWTPAAPAFAFAVVLGITSMGLYQTKQRLTFEGVVARLAIGIAIGVMCVALINLFLPVETAGRSWILCFPISLVLIGATRIGFWRWMERGSFKRAVLVYGAGKRAAYLLKLRRLSDRRGFNIVAFLQAPGDELVLDDSRVTILKGSLVDIAKQNRVDEIVVAMDDRRNGLPSGELLECRFAGIAIVDMLTFLERETGRLKLDLANPSWLIFSEGFEKPFWLRIVTRGADLASAVFLLALAMPIMVAVAVAIVLDDGWPIIYSQRRVGRMGKTFTLYKFRSMLRTAEADGAPRWAQTIDSRVTRVGAIIRKLRLDELPQLFNVLCGHMSLVGPRPERPEFVVQLSEKIPYYPERHSVKPGITGWAQLSYPYGASDHDAQEKLQYDLYYIKHKSVVLDLMILLQTLEVVLWRKGAR